MKQLYRSRCFASALWTLVFFLLGQDLSAQLSLGKKKKNPEDEYKTYYQLKDQVFLGISPFVDNTSGIVRSFALYELLREHPIRLNGQPLVPALVNFPFSAPYAVSGSIEGNQVKLKVYVNGKKTAEEYARPEMSSIYSSIVKGLGGQADPALNLSKVKIDEGDPDELEEKSINQLLPGELACRVPEDTIVNIFKQLQAFETFTVKDAYEATKEIKGRFDPIDETDIKFFKWPEVPFTLKNIARKLIFPRTAGMGPALSYLATGNKLHNEGDGQAAIHCYIGTIGTSKDLLASPFEASALRYVAFRELAKIYDSPKENRKKTAELFRMVSAAHLSYLNHPSSKKERSDYYNAITEVGVTLREAESSAYTQRSQRTLALINSGLNAANSMTAMATGNQQAAGLFKSNTERGVLETMAENKTRTEQLGQKYNDYDKKVNAGSFRLSDGMNFDQGKPISPNEISYLLVKTPETAQSALNAFAADKPKLKKLVAKFYQTRADADLGALFQYFTDYEMKVVNYECRGIAIPAAVTAEF